jgi:hypothetical protein
MIEEEANELKDSIIEFYKKMIDIGGKDKADMALSSVIVNVKNLTGASIHFGG